MKQDTRDILWGLFFLALLLLGIIGMGVDLEMKRRALERVSGRPVSTLDAWLLTRDR